MPSIYTKLPEKKEGDAIGSLDQGAARARRNPPVPAALPVGWGVEEVCELTEDRVEAKERSGAAMARGLAAPTSTGRWTASSGTG
jgi:hypothetical protein